jgi:hypothetical protein
MTMFPDQTLKISSAKKQFVEKTGIASHPLRSSATRLPRTGKRRMLGTFHVGGCNPSAALYLNHLNYFPLFAQLLPQSLQE